MASLSEARMQGLKWTFSFAPSANWFLFLLLLICCVFFSPLTRAQESAALGEVSGEDISVLGPSSAVSNSAVPAIAFSSGDTVVVHSGKARVEFTGGGELDVCGPAKFTVLASDLALTVALSFGRVHLKFDALRPIAIYTPLTIATPLAIQEQPRDATVGLTNNGAMCVLASHGAIRLQNQLSGESVVVPQPSEVLLKGELFQDFPPAAGQCRCEFDGASAQRKFAPQPSAQPSPPAMVAVNRTPPATHSPVQSAPSLAPSVAQTATAKPVVKIAMPPIAYDAKSGVTPAEPLSVATLMLAQEAIVEPEWVFHGVVVEPVKGRKNAEPSSSTSARERKGRGFWAKFRDFLIGKKTA